MKIIKVISSKLKDASVYVKFLKSGKSDVQEKFVIAPYGYDAMPIKDSIGVYSETGVSGEEVLLGFLNKHCVASPGESGLFSTDENDELKIYLRLKKNGEIHFGGDVDNLVKYKALNAELTSFKNQVQAQLALIQTGITGVGGVYTPGTLTLNISDAKADKLKTM